MDWKSHRIDALLEQALVEDQAVADATTNLTIDPELRATASIVARQEMIVAGLGAVPRFFEIFARLDPRPQAHNRFDVIHHPEMFDGVRVHKGQVLAVIRHNARVLLSCERVILNLLQHLSGIATLTRKFVDAVEGTHARVLDTRKTVPGLRALEKYAVLCGGGTNHRIDLASGILIKNNHIALGGGMRAALTSALEHRRHHQRIQVEVRTAQELEEALEFGAEAILLNNMTPEQVRQSVERIKHVAAEQAAKRQATEGRSSQGTSADDKAHWIPTEASGGIILDNIRAYAETGVDFISVGALTHSAKAADISMTIVAESAR
jgi:nicotinate-nucleotide pyrophosphorylase (carboxylating)